MKRILLITLILSLACTPLWARGLMMVGGGVAAAACNDCTGRLICQNFEGTGADNSETWTGTGNVDYATAPLRGTQSVEVVVGENLTGHTFSGGGDFWGFFRVKMADGQPSATNYFFQVQDSDNLSMVRFATLTTGAIRHYQGTANQSSSAGTLGDGATGIYCFWFHAERGGSENAGHLHTWFDLCTNVCNGTVCTRPESEGITAVTAGTWDNDPLLDAHHIYQTTLGTDNVTYLDQILIDDAEITTVCDN